MGFSGRVKKNLEYISKQRAQKADVHVVTQLVTSLLALIVYPYEAFKNTAALGFASTALESLEKKGWPHWKFDNTLPERPPRTLRQLAQRARAPAAYISLRTTA